ncbi:cobaltochelatase subunit CobN, partial [bacterium]|nr:cobaltochelatase subunit CobN [bacterium]
ESSVKAKEIMRRKGFTAEDAEEFSTVRTVGAVPGTYGTGIIPFVENGNHWNCKTMAAEAYLTYMGVIYTRKYWGMEKRGVLEALLHDADTIVQPLSNNTCGPLSLDHIYEYVGGVSAAISYITGNKPDAFIHSIIEKNNPKVISIENAVEEEKRDSFCNPFYIRRVMEGETASTKALARTFRNTFGWNVLRPSVLSESMWAELFSLYVDDSAGIGIGRYFEEINPHGFQEITGILLEAARKQFWCPDTDACTELAVRHAQSVVAHEMVSNSFVTDNPALIEMIKVYLPESLLNGYSKKIDLKENDRDNQFDHIKEMLGSSMAAMVSVMILTVLFAGSFVVYLCGERTTSQEVT